MKQWNRTVPSPETFIHEINDFLEQFSLDPKASNPTVKEPTPDVDPTTLTEEQQMELAIKQSLGNEREPSSEEEEQESDGVELNSHIDEFDNIKPIKHEEPPNKPGITTRIQIRTGDGKRIVRRFNADDLVRKIYEVVKADLEGFDSCRFTLGDHQRNDLIEKLDISIEDAGLKNSSLLLEKTEAQDE